jgi:hypothetical protein
MIRGFERAVLSDARRLDDAGESEPASDRHLALIRFARHYQQRGYQLQISIATGVVSRVYESLLSRVGRIDQSRESLLSMSSTLSSPPYAFSPNYEVAWLRDYAFRRGFVELQPAAWDWLAEGGSNRTAEARQRLALVRCLPWEQERMRRFLDYTIVVPFVDQRATIATSQWRMNTIGGDLFMENFEDSRRTWQTTLDVLRAAVQLRILLLASKKEHGDLPQTLAELAQEFPGQVPVDPATGAAWVYRPQGVASEERLQQPFIWSPGSSALRFGMGPPRDADMAIRGDVFVIEPRDDPS